MGKYNSSTYRVIPFVNYIKNNITKLNIFLSLLERPGCSFKISSLPNDEDWFCGDNEKKLKPSKNHLKGTIEYIASNPSFYNDAKNKNRKELVSNDFATKKRKKEEAFRLLDADYNTYSPTSRKWFVFEGFTQPDLFVEGDTYILLGEGKWTENHITTATTHLNEKNGGYRNQMIRHIEGALNYCKTNNKNKRIIAFYIVDGKCGYAQDLTRESLIEQLDRETIGKSETLKAAIIDSFAGYTTWQQIENAFPEMERFKTKKEIDFENK